MSNWTKAELQDVATINPSRPRKSSIEDPEEPVSFVEMAAVSEDSCQIEYEEEREIMEVRSGYTYFDRCDVLMAKITPCFENGKVAVADIKHERGFGSTEFHVFRPDPTRLHRRYLYYFLRDPAFRKQAEQQMTGSAGQKRVPTRYVKEVDIPLPSLDVQHRIVTVLDRADALRTKRKEVIERFDDLLQAAFFDLFGDPVANPKGW
jgi:type I restriction enzyme S subunit